MNKLRARRKEKIDFLLESSHYQRLQLFLYGLSVLAILLVYLLIVYLFGSNVYVTYVTGFFSLMIGLYFFYNRNKFVKAIDDKLQKRKRDNYKRQSKVGLKTTLKRIAPKNSKLKLNIKGKTTLKEKMANMKSKVTPKKKGQKDYIEIE